jgi:Fur family ferric uptake transcriptional regulator
MQQVVTRSAGVDRASVYRTIALFERIGIVQRLQTGWKYRLELSDSFHEHHHHATCIECGCTISLHEDAKLEQFLAELAQKYHFKLSAHQLELQGLCQNCQK